MSFSVGGSHSRGSNTQQTQNDLPDWLKSSYISNLQGAQALAAQGFQPYSQPLTASDNGYLAAAREQAMNATQAGKDVLGNASNVYSQIANQSPYFFDAAQTGDIVDVNPALAATTYGQAASVDPAAYHQRVQSGSFSGSDLAAYLNPYQSGVIDQSNAAIERQRQIAQQQNGYAASQAGAFGGSRHGIVDAENNRNFAQMQQDTTNALLNQGYDRAAGLLTSDLDRAMQAGLANQAAMTGLYSSDADRRQQAALANQAADNASAQANADRLNAAAQYNSQADWTARNADADRRQAGAIANAQIDQANTGFNLQAAQGLTGVAQQQQSQALQGAQALLQAGSQLQQNQQAGLDAAYQEFLRGQQDPIQRQQLLNSTLFGIDQGGLTSTSTNGRSNNSQMSGGIGK